MRHWATLEGDRTICGLDFEEFDHDTVKIVHVRDWELVDCPTCAPVAREHGKAMADEHRERHDKEVTAEIDAGARRVRETAFALAWVRYHSLLGAERLSACEAFASEAAEGWRVVERKRRLHS